MKKRVLSLLLALVMALSLAVPVFAAEDEFQAEEPMAPVEEEAPVMEEPAAPVEEAPVAEEPAAPAEAAPAEPMPEEAPAVPVWEPETVDLPMPAAIDEPAPASREEDGLGDADLVSPIIASGMYDGSSARKMLDLINDFRTGPDAWYWNETNTAKVVLQDLQPLTYDYALERIAMWRAAELVLNFDHMRPDGTMPDSLIIHGVSTWAENIAYGTGPVGLMQNVFNGWAETNYGYAGQGHRRNMLSSRYTAVGIACFIYNGAYFWVQEFGCENSGAADPYAQPTLPAGAVTGGYCGCVSGWDNMIWYFTADGTLTFSGEGEMEDYDYSYTVWGEDFDPMRVRRIVVEEGVTRIGAFVFASDDLLNVTEISLPSTLTSIGVGAFNGTFGLDELTLPAAVTTVEDYAFSGSGLTVRPAPGNESYVEKDGVLFTKDMSELVYCPWGRTGTYTVPSSVKTVRAGAFMLSGLTGVTLPEGLTEIGTEAFEYSELTKIEIPASVTKIGATAFGACEKLTSVTVLNPDCEIEEDAWGGGETLGLAGTATVYGHAGSTAQTFAREYGFTFKSLDGGSSQDDIPPAPRSGTGWMQSETTGDIYFYKNGQLKKGFWVGSKDGASKWANNWYYVGNDGRLLTGFQYLDDLKGGKAWYMLQVDNENGEIGKMLSDWQWTYTRAGWGYFSPSYGSQGMCLYTDAWGEYNAAWGLWQDGLAHRGTK